MIWRWTGEDARVTQLRVDHQFWLLLGDGTSISIAEPFELTCDGDVAIVPPGDEVHEVAAALPLFNQLVTAAEAADSGELTVRFESGAHLRVPVNEHYETWQIASVGGEQWVGLPGGGVAHLPAP